MPIAGAIFDCDGTLVDSMGMWHDVEIALLVKHGVADPERVYEETEPIAADAMCDLFHTRYGAAPTGPELFDEMTQMVRDAYENDVQIFLGCKKLLQELHDAGVRMAVASATTTDEVRVALRAHGIERYFDYVISTADVGAGKERPDVYLRACELLGTEIEDTWVFEDAPFGLRTARRAGFHTACVFNDHDGRDERVCRQYADIFSHGYTELSLAALNDYARASASVAGVLKALVVAGSPEPSLPALVGELADAADYVVAADRGAEVLFEAGVAPDVFCGDADSVGKDALAWARRVSRSDIEFPADKYATDLALALACAQHEADRRASALELVVTCATGGRLDHGLAVVGQLAKYAASKPRLIEDAFECQVLLPEGRGEWQLPSDAIGRTLSAIPLAPATVVSEKGLKWGLERRELSLLDDLGISNVVVSDTARVTCHAGVLAVFLLK